MRSSARPCLRVGKAFLSLICHRTFDLILPWQVHGMMSWLRSGRTQRKDYLMGLSTACSYANHPIFKPIPTYIVKSMDIDVGSFCGDVINVVK
jgi:hypothetical protein